jgi:hypothetical protein
VKGKNEVMLKIRDRIRRNVGMGFKRISIKTNL